MRDFTLSAYERLLRAYQEHGYHLCSYAGYLANQNGHDKYVMLRHDVDKKPLNSLQTAQLEHRLGVNGTYYFRIVEESFDATIIQQIAALGHEIGYHYEDVALCRGDFAQAIEHFEKGLRRMRQYYPVTTICMHGSPLSKWDNRSLWKEYDYRDFGIVAEPYFDLDFQETYYLTDTGRRWDGTQVSVRDTVASGFSLRLKSTVDIVSALRRQALPARVMQNIHPQRWSDGYAAWMLELMTQNAKNVLKYALIRARKDGAS